MRQPEGCCKLFIGNLSYEIDDEAIARFFMTVKSELKAVRWLYHPVAISRAVANLCMYYTVAINIVLAKRKKS